MTLKGAKPTPYPAVPKTLGDHLKKRRYELGLSQKEAALRLGVNEWTIHNWECDKTQPPVRFVPKCIQFLGYDPYPAPHTLGKRLIAKRRQLGLSRKRLAKRLGVDEGTLARWEKGEGEPGEKLIDIVRTFLAVVR